MVMAGWATTVSLRRFRQPNLDYFTFQSVERSRGAPSYGTVMKDYDNFLGAFGETSQSRRSIRFPVKKTRASRL